MTPKTTNGMSTCDLFASFAAHIPNGLSVRQPPLRHRLSRFRDSLPPQLRINPPDSPGRTPCGTRGRESGRIPRRGYPPVTFSRHSLLTPQPSQRRSTSSAALPFALSRSWPHWLCTTPPPPAENRSAAPPQRLGPCPRQTATPRGHPVRRPPDNRKPACCSHAGSLAGSINTSELRP